MSSFNGGFFVKPFQASLPPRLAELEVKASKQALTADEVLERKVLTRKHKNREAAQNSRNKRKAHLEFLESRVQNFAAENSNLKSEVAQLRKQYAEVEKMRQQHRALTADYERLLKEHEMLKAQAVSTSMVPSSSLSSSTDLPSPVFPAAKRARTSMSPSPDRSVKIEEAAAEIPSLSRAYELAANGGDSDSDDTVDMHNKRVAASSPSFVIPRLEPVISPPLNIERSPMAMASSATTSSPPRSSLTTQTQRVTRSQRNKKRSATSMSPSSSPTLGLTLPPLPKATSSSITSSTKSAATLPPLPLPLSIPSSKAPSQVLGSTGRADAFGESAVLVQPSPQLEVSAPRQTTPILGLLVMVVSLLGLTTSRCLSIWIAAPILSMCVLLLASTSTRRTATAAAPSKTMPTTASLAAHRHPWSPRARVSVCPPSMWERPLRAVLSRFVLHLQHLQGPLKPASWASSPRSRSAASCRRLRRHCRRAATRTKSPTAALATRPIPIALLSPSRRKRRDCLTT